MDAPSVEDELFQTALLNSIGEYDKTLTLKPKQVECLRKIYSGNDVVVNLPTGYGKSVIYHLLPNLFRNKLKIEINCPATVLVLCPLNIIQEDQNKLLSSKGIRACRLDMLCNVSTIPHATCSAIANNSNIELVKKGYFDIVHCHPEALFSTDAGKNLLDDEKFLSTVVSVVVDECHKVEEW